MLANSSVDDFKAIPTEPSPSSHTINMEVNSDHGSQFSANQAFLENQENARNARNRTKQIVFVILFIALLLARTDQGIVPAIATNLKKQFNMNSLEIGSLGSMVYLGATAGCVMAIPLLDILPTKVALVACYIVQGIALYLFTFSAEWFDLAAGRFLSGAC